jgi:hypothetical protein
MHHANAVEEPGVGRAGENQAQNIILADVAQALEKGVVNHLDFMPIQWDAAMHRVHDELVVGSEQVVDGTSHGYKSPKLMTRPLLYHRGMPE